MTDFTGGRNRSAMPASHQFSQLARDLYRMGPVQRRRMRMEFTRIGQAMQSDARSRAGAWSSRIPSAITTRAIADAGTARVGVELRVSKSVPHARAYEGISQQGSIRYFRHPVFADPDKPRNEWTWTQKNSETRPYAWPAVSGRAADARRAVLDTYEAAARECGFR
jgi:hypothetical protein